MAGKIPENFIDDLLNRVNIVEVIEGRVPLIKAGREYKACCPFHEEKTPSFYVSPQKQFFHCFGCGESGSAISFLMKFNNLSFRDSIEELASIAGVKIPVDRSYAPQSGEFEKLLGLMEKVQAVFKNELFNSDQSSAPKTYLKGRHVSRETALKFGIGFAPDRWDFLISKFGRSLGDRVLLKKAGLVTENERGDTYDRFRGRLMFPIMDRRGRVIAFGGRIINDGQPKYLNSPETPLFNKSNQLFGLHLALAPIRKDGKVIIVEGYTDVVALSQAGIENVVATLGTATTTYHIRELFRATSEIVFCFDGDTAGKTAAWRALEITLPEMYDGRMVSFAFLPQGEDPDSVVQKEGKDGFLNHVSNSEAITDFIFRELLSRTDINRHDGRAKLIEDFKPILNNLPDSALRQLMIHDIENRIGLDSNFIKSQLTQTNVPRRPRRSLPQDNSINLKKLKYKALATLIQNPQFARVVADSEYLTLSRDAKVQLLVKLSNIIELNPDINTAALVEKFRESESFPRIQLLATSKVSMLNEGLKLEFYGMIFNLEIKVIEEQIHELQLKCKDQNEMDEKESLLLNQRILERMKLWDKAKSQKMHS